MRTSIEKWLLTFSLESALQLHTVEVMLAVPAEVRSDLMDDASFRLSDYEPRHGMHVTVASPPAGRPARSVSLKRTLGDKPPAFIRYVIAHELAHAFLRNAGRTPHEDPELAADALAAAWGFPRPEVWPFPPRR